MSYDDWKTTDRSDYGEERAAAIGDALRAERKDEDAIRAFDELHRELEKLEQTGVALRAERDRLDAELSRLREERRIIELGASQELWRWQFTWFWTVVATVARLQAMSVPLTSVRTALHVAVEIDTPTPRLTYEEITDLYDDIRAVYDWLTQVPEVWS